MKKKEDYKLKYFPWRWGDRRDGWRVRNVDPLAEMIPYFFRKRMDSQIYFEATFPIDEIEAFVKKHKEEIPGLSLMHVIIAATVRVFSQRPKLNRFISRNKLYARKYINVSLIVKKSMTDEGEEDWIKIYFHPTDTLYDVVKKVQQALDEAHTEGKQDTGNIAINILSILPSFLKRFMVSTLVWMDKLGVAPRAFEEGAPFFTSVFLSNIGSIGAESVYHHLYEVGTCSMFMAMGTKSTQHITRRTGEVQTFKTIKMKFTFDERIADGFYFASSIRTAFRISQDPGQLLTPPEQVIVDDGVGRKRKDQP